MKKWILCTLCLLILLAGCTEQQKETTPTTAGEFSMDTGDFSYYVNISDESVWDLCPFMDTQLTYMLLTREPLDQNSMVAFQFTGSCETTHVECSEEWMTEFPFWLYQTYRGVDWKEVAALAEAAHGGDAEAKEKLGEYETLYLEDYEALSAGDIPQLYGYWVSNDVTTVNYGTGEMAAQYEALSLTIGDEEVSVDVGLLNVFRKGWDQYLAAEEVGNDIYMGRLTDASTTYWGDGIVTLAPMVIPEADEPQTLTGVELYGIAGEILDIQVSFGGNIQSWDGNSKLEIPTGTATRLTVTLKTQANQTVGYCEDANLMILREMGGRNQRLWYFVSISQSWNIYELYAMMVDGLDISSYYAYSTGWAQPKPAQKPQSATLSFDTVTVAETDDYSLCVTGASWDDHAYTLHFSAANRSEQEIDLSLGNVYINSLAFRDYSMPLKPGETGEYKWHIAWEALEEYGLYAQTGEDIVSIEFTLNPLYDGLLPRDENGNMIINEEYTCISPMGSDAGSDFPIPGTVVLETDEIRLYAVQFATQPYSCLAGFSRPLTWSISFVIENLDEGTLSYMASDFRVDGVSVDGIDAGTFRAGSSRFSTVSLYLTEANQVRIDDPEILTFALILNNTDTYTVTIDLKRNWRDSQLWEENY